MGNSSSTPVNKGRRRSNRLSKPLPDPTTLTYLKVQSAQPSQTTIHLPPSSRTQLHWQACNRTDLTGVEPPATGHDAAHRRHSRPDLGRPSSGQETEMGPKLRSNLGSFVGGLPDRLSRSRSTLSHLPGPSPHESYTTDRSPLSFIPKSESMVTGRSSQYVHEGENGTRDGSVIRMDSEKSPSHGLFHDNPVATGRRNSLQTPGIATRTPNGQGPRISESHRSSHGGYSHSSNPIAWPQNYQNNFTPPHPGASPEPRVTTPTQLENRQLGGLKLGTLRITNGYPPATPNDEAQRIISNQLSSEPMSTKAHHKLTNIPTKEVCPSQTNLPGRFSHVGSGLGLQVASHVDPGTPELSPNSQRARAGDGMETNFRNDKPPNDLSLRQYLPSATNELFSTPSEELPSCSLDSPFSFEVSPTRMTIPTIDEFDDRSFEDEGVDISPGNTEYQNPDSRPLENGPRKDNIHSLQDRPEQPLRKADSGYSSATSRRTNSSRGRVGINTFEECDSFSDKVTSWNSVGNSSDDYRESWQPHFDVPLPENDIISQPSRSSDRQFNDYHTSRSVSHLKPAESSARSSRRGREESMVEFHRISFQDPFSTTHLPQEQAHHAAPIHRRESFQTQTPPNPVDLTARCGCVIRFHSLNDSHGIHSPDEVGLLSRRISAPVPAILSHRTDQYVPRAQATCACGTTKPQQTNIPPTYQPKQGKSTRRRRSSGTRGTSPLSNGNVGPRPREIPQDSPSSNLLKEPIQSSGPLRVRRSVGPSHQLSRPRSLASLKSRSPSEYREQPSASREPSLWGEDISVYSDSASLAETQLFPMPGQDSIPPVPPLPTNLKSKKSFSEQLGFSQTKTSNPNRESQPRKLVKSRRGSIRHPRDNRVMVNGNF